MPSLLVTGSRLIAQVLDGQSCRLCSPPTLPTAQRPVPVSAAKRVCRRHERLYASHVTSDELDAEVDQAFRDAINEVLLMSPSLKPCILAPSRLGTPVCLALFMRLTTTCCRSPTDHCRQCCKVTRLPPQLWWTSCKSIVKCWRRRVTWPQVACSRFCRSGPCTYAQQATNSAQTWSIPVLPVALDCCLQVC